MASVLPTLLSPPDLQASIRKATLLLNSRTYNLEQAKRQHDELELKLSKSTEERDALLTQTKELARSHLQSAQELSLIRHSLADELSLVSKTLVSSFGNASTTKMTLLEEVETLHRRLKELESVKSYLQVIESALILSEKSIHDVESVAQAGHRINHASIKQYTMLQEYVANVKRTVEGQVDGEQSIQLTAFLEQLLEQTWKHMKSTLASLLLSASEAINWPMKVEYNSSSLERFSKAFINLLTFQTMATPNSSPELLYAIQALVPPIAARFKYHFEGERETNKIDKPEWYFTHVLNVVHEQRGFMNGAIQDLLNKTAYKDISALNEFTLALFPLLSRKICKTVPIILDRPSLLAHTVYQSLSFDASTLEAGFDLTTTTSRDEERWKGISNVILERKDWLKAWIDGETEFAQSQFREIISAPDAWQFTDANDDARDDLISPLYLPSTNSARRMKGLVEQITDRYSPLPDFATRTKFLIDVQLPILEAYLSRIGSSLDAFETLSFAFVRAVPGALQTVAIGGSGSDAGVKLNTEKLTSGPEGLLRLGKALISARFMEGTLKGWGEEVFFLELWTEINKRASLRSRAEASGSLPDTFTSEESPEETIFQELIDKFSVLCKRTEDMVVQQVCGEVERGLRAHLSGPVAGEEFIALSPTLLASVALLSSHLTHMQNFLSDIGLVTIYRRIASRLAEHILHRQILYRGRAQISSTQGQVLRAEAYLWVETCKRALSTINAEDYARVEVPWSRLLEGAKLVAATGEQWEKLVDAMILAPVKDNKWLNIVEEVVGSADLSWEETRQTLATREDCPR